MVRFLAKISSTITHQAIQTTICIDDDAIEDWYDITNVHIIQKGPYKQSNGQIIYAYDETLSWRDTLDKSINRSAMAKKPGNNKSHLLQPMMKLDSDIYMPRSR